MKEIEKTYLAKYIPEEVWQVTPNEMIDVYIPVSAKHPKLRIRKNGDKYEITKKVKVDDNDASECEESTIKLTKGEFEVLSQLPCKKVIKNRYACLINGVGYEFDVHQGDLAGLVVVDIEFTSTEQKDSFVPPDFCLMDVTQDEFIAGGLLAGKKFFEIEAELAKRGYQAINV